MEVERTSLYRSRRRRSPIVFDDGGDASSSVSFRRTKRSRILFDDNSDEDDDLRYSEAVNGGGGAEGEQVETEYSPLNAYYGGGDAVAEDQSRRGGGRAGEGQLPRPRVVVVEEDSDDERPIRFVRRGSTAPSQAPAPVATAPEPSPSSCSDSSSVIRGATVENGALDCSICYLPLKPPIFQCDVGHVVCCRCYDKLRQATRCHKCRAPTPGGYRRSYDMESLVGAIRVPCPHAAHGCAHRPAYHDRDAHARACPHAPCRCPGEACGVAGPPAALADHVAAHHGWPCTAKNQAGAGTPLVLRDGFNFLTAPRPAASPDDHGGAASKFLFLLNVVPAPPFGRAVTAFCIHPDRAATATLWVGIYGGEACNDMCIKHQQWSEFKVGCTDLSDGLPDPSSGCFVFVVPWPDREEVDDTTRIVVGVTPPHIQ